MFYRLVFARLERVFSGLSADLRLLDFGSGFGIAARHFSSRCRVTAIEPDAAMLPAGTLARDQRAGSLDELKTFSPGSFDFVLCHNVLEYVDGQHDCLGAPLDALKPGGKLSLVCHHFPGRVLAAAVYDKDPAKAMKLLEGSLEAGGDLFGPIRYLEKPGLERFLAERSFRIEEEYGVRTAFGLVGDNDIKFDPAWDECMFRLEMELGSREPWRDIAFWKHYVIGNVRTKDTP